MRLHHARATYQPQANFKTFLYQIAHNRLIDILRQHHAVLASDLGERAEDGVGVFDLITNETRHIDIPNAILIQKQHTAQLHRQTAV